MDFALTEEQEAIVGLARQIFTDRGEPEHLKEVEAGAEWFDRDLWAELAKSELLGIALPEADGGGGFGFLEAALLLQEQGRAVTPVPLLATIVLGALPLAEFGSAPQRARWLPGVVAGDTLLTAAIAEVGTSDPREPYLRAEADGDGWRLTGAKTAVPAAHVAAAILVPARTDDGVAVFIVESGADGLTIGRQDTFNHEPTFHLDFDGVAVGRDDLLGPIGPEVVGFLVDRGTVGLCALASGIADTGMRLTAGYASERKQFNVPVGSFQAVGHRMADCFADNEAIRLSMLYAASLLAEGREADKEVAVAKYWASWGGSRIAHADLHVHGGISIDLDYPIHRYFLWAKQIEFTLGPAAAQLGRLGEILADEPVAAG